MDLKTALDLLKEFLTPANKLDQIGLDQISLETILRNTIDNFEKAHENLFLNVKCEQDVFWKFALICLNLLKEINESTFEKNQYNCYLNVNEERLVASCCQMISCFGIHYNLVDDIGISIDKLSKYGVNISKKRQDINIEVRNSRLVECLNYIYQFKANSREHIDLINGIFYRRHMHDLICALIQISHSADLMSDEKEKFLKWLQEELFDDADGALIISNLLMAQSRPTSSNSWFTLTIGKLLTKCLMRPNSVMNVIRAVLTQMNALSDVIVASDWKKCDLVAKILVQCPKETNINDYMKFIAPQITDLFFNLNPRFSKQFYRVAGSVYSLFALRWPEQTKEYFTKKILAPFSDEKIETKSINGKELKLLVSNIHLVYVSSTEPSWHTLKQLPPCVLDLLFKLYVLLYKKMNVKSTRDRSEEILKLYVRMMPNNFNEFMIEMLRNSLLNETLVFANFDMFDDDCNEDVIVNITRMNCSTTLETVEDHCRCLVNLIKSLNEHENEIQFMLFIFEQINKNYASDAENINLNSGNKNDSSLLEIEHKLTHFENEINSKILYFILLSTLFETIDPQLVLAKYEKIIDFCKSILENISNVLKKNNELLDEEASKHENETIHLVLSIISVFTTGLIEIDYEVKKKLQKLLPCLADLKELFWNSELREMVESLFTSIGTYCAINSKDLKTEQTNENKSNFVKNLIEELDDNNNLDEYERAVRDLKDPLIPVRAHGLVSLRKLIEKKNVKCQENSDFLLEQFVNNLKFEDSYVYLAAINGLIALVDRNPDKVLDVLIEHYSNLNNKKLDMENRLKVGEILTKTTRNFAELLPKYSTKLINAFLIGCKHDDEFFRSSSLSNLGETCKLLKYAISQNIHEIINCLSSLIEFDLSLNVKRSAVMVLKMIIEGLKKENFIHILGDSMLPLYRLLSKTKSLSNDDIIKTHCQLTNEYLNELMKESLFPKLKLEKEIKVLRP